MMMEETVSDNKQEKIKRPVSLTVLCILTFIFSGLGAVSALFTIFFSDEMILFLKATPNFDETLMAETIQLLKAGWVYYTIVFFLSLTSLWGAILMWKFKKIGFHFYALSNAAFLFIPTLFLNVSLSWDGILMTAGFIVLYAFNLKYMS